MKRDRIFIKLVEEVEPLAILQGYSSLGDLIDNSTDEKHFRLTDMVNRNSKISQETLMEIAKKLEIDFKELEKYFVSETHYRLKDKEILNRKIDYDKKIIRIKELKKLKEKYKEDKDSLEEVKNEIEKEKAFLIMDIMKKNK